MKRRVVALGLDSADPERLEAWFAAGHLPNLRRLRAQGMFCRFENTVRYVGGEAPYASTEGCWVALQTGVRPTATGYWETVAYDPASYTATNDPVKGGYDYREFPPFFALGDEFRVAVFDVPVSALSERVNGVQIVGWGGHFPFVRRGSQPESLLQEITQRHGANEILYNDYGVFWNPKYLRWLERTSIDSVRKRTAVCLELLDRGPWDLLLAVFGETHGASHDLWFAGDAGHPVHGAWRGSGDPLLRVFEAVDDAVGKIAARVPSDACFVVFSAHGMQANQTDLFNFFILPELLYRFNFPGRFGFAAGNPDVPPPPVSLAGRHWYWFGDIWRRRHAPGRLRRWFRSLLPGWLVWPAGEDFLFPYLLDWFGPPCGWMPSFWYRPAWPRMRAFALPSFADGHVRINVQGRDAHGIVRPEEYDRECRRVTEFLRGVRHGRTGRPIVGQVIRTRRSARHDDPKLPHADLVIVWDREPADVVDSPDVGRIGPVPYYRTGGHRNTGFMLAAGPGIEPGSVLPMQEVVDFPATILQMMGAPIPEYFEGVPLLDSAGAVTG
jgi:predicted AlkP superfamily phosphohydrolase/phosphomutase